jgi:hypothetical protein
MRVAARVIVALLIAIGIARITSTYLVFNHTIDEGAHLACGIQWYEGVYTYDPKHTPIARISIALLPYLDGLRGYGDPSFWQEGVRLLSSGGRYWRNLTLARIGTLPFFILATVMVYLWARRVYGVATGVLAAGIFTLLPVVLAHSGLATTDIALTAFFLVAAYAFTRWLAAPNWRNAIGFGLAAGLAVSTKLSTLAFLPATMAGVIPLYLASARQQDDRWRTRTVLGSAVIAAICVCVVIWACYRFSHASIDQFSSAPDRIANKLFGAESAMAREVHALTATVQLPAPDLYAGLRDLRDVNREGPRSYLLGQVKQGGWWYFYPVAIVFKTPLAVLLLAIIGSASLLFCWLRARAQWRPLVPLLAAIAVVAVVMPSRLDIGVRHVMPVFAFMAMLAAVGAVTLWNRHSKLARGATVGLLAWLVASSVLAHPDYLSYFNELGGNNPAQILVISDLDWGQDLTRLSGYLRQHQVKHVSIAYENYFDGQALGLPDSVRLRCGEPATGWVAVEERRARVYPECFQWLAARPVKAYVGKSMRIYYLPETVSAR